MSKVDQTALPGALIHIASASVPMSPAAPTGYPDPLAVLNSIGEAVYDWDLTTDRIAWGPNAALVLGVDSMSRIDTGFAYGLCIAPDSPGSRFEAVMRTQDRDFGSGVRYEVQYGLTGRMRGSLDTIWVEDTGRWFAGPDGRPAHAHGLVRVVTERFQQMKQLAFLSKFDPLTGAFNRVQLAEYLTRRIDEIGQGNAVFGFLLIAIEQLGHFNRHYGYDIGDQIIAGVTQRLRTLMRATDVLARYAGNKLAIVLDSCDPEQTSQAAVRFMNEISGPAVDTRAGPLPVALRIGSVVAPRHGRTAHRIFQHAEEALDVARASTTTRHVAYEPSLQIEVQRRQAQMIAEQVVSALNTRRIEIELEPVIIAKTGKASFYEALVRLRLEDGTILPPASFLGVAETVGLIPLLDQRVMELSLERLARDPALQISVNVSGTTVHELDWIERLRSALALQPGAADRLVIEITETVAIADPEATRLIISALNAMHVRVAMDDFGAGHTSFRNLRSLGFNLLKIDGAFVQNLSKSSDDRFFVRTLVELARHIGVATVAEWVEDAETAQILLEWGVDYFQGFLFSREQLPDPALPMPAASSAA